MLLMAIAFCSPDGRPFEVADERKQLCAFAIDNNFIDNASHYSNVVELLKPSSGKKQLQMWQPVAKLRWMMLFNKRTQ